MRQPASLAVGLSAAIGLGSLFCSSAQLADALSPVAPLEPPIIMIGGFPLHAPWRVFEWRYRYGGIAPRADQIADAILGAGFIGAAGSLALARRRPGSTVHGSARWAALADARKASLLGRAGLMLGAFEDRYLRHDGPEHVMCVAPTRSGKGVGLVVPTLLSWPDSVLILDVKAENWRLTAGWRAGFSDCLRFDPTAEDSARFNPLLEIRRGPNEVRDAQNVADILVDPDGALERRSHWDKTAHALLTGAILHVLYAEAEKTLARVASLLSDPAVAIEATLERMIRTPHLGAGPHPVVAGAARELLDKAPNERSGVVSTALSFLALYRDPVVARATSASDWRIADLMRPERPLSLYLATPPSDLSRVRALLRLILNQTLRRLTETHPEGGPARRLLLMLDEFPALGRLDFFESALGFLAGYGVRAFLIAQSLSQLDKAYGPNNAVLDNCHVRVAFAPNDERTARRISDLLGAATIEHQRRSRSGRGFLLDQVSVADQLAARPLLTPGEVMALPADEAIIFAAGTPPIRARKLRYYELAAFRERLLAPPSASGALTPRAHDWTGQISAAPEAPPVAASAETPGFDAPPPQRPAAQSERPDAGLFARRGDRA